MSHSSSPSVNTRSSNTSTITMGKPDRLLLLSILLLLGMGLLSVYSASAYHAQQESGYSFALLLKQGGAAVIGLLCMGYFSTLKPSFWNRWGQLYALVVLALLALTLLVGKTANGSERWLPLPIVGQFQPSELAKLSVVILMAQATSQARRVSPLLLVNAMLALLMIGLIFKQPNLSITLLLTSLVGMMLLLGRWPLWLFAVALPPAGWWVWQKITTTEYQWRRIVGWLDPWKDSQDTGYNLVQSYFAIGSGGLLGTGYGQSIQKQFYLPFPYTDFIFSVICEEWGLVGGVMLIGAFGLLIWRGLRTALRCPTMFGKQMAAGITFVIGLQAIINMAVTTGLMPVTGVTLPLISYGGTSMVVTLSMLGVLVGLSRLSHTVVVDSSVGSSPSPSIGEGRGTAKPLYS
ncbi:MAG: putative peptidoglycan glycosyltransferase FtsW [Vampirovibrionales bacterium]